MTTVDKLPRPRVVGGINIKVKTGCGNMYVQMGWWSGSLHEVFATLGKAGGCATCFNESLTRTVTSGLRCGMQVAEFIKQLKGVKCPTPMPFPKEEAIESCPDALSKALEKYGSLTTEGMIKLIQDLNAQPSDLSDEEEEREAYKRIEGLKAEREKLEH